MPIYLVLKNGTFCAGIKIFYSLPPLLTIIKKNRAKFKAVLRNYLNTQLFYSVYKIFMFKDDI
jgi:hypothetical protein